MGSRNFTAALGRATAVILADLEHAIYADDCAGGKAEPEDPSASASRQPAKFPITCSELECLGRVLRRQGARE
jgi:hypothetical protein